MRGRQKLILPALFLAIVASGCGGQSYGDVTEESIVQVDLPKNVLTNAGFEDGELPPWTALIPKDSDLEVTDAVAHHGSHSLRVDVTKGPRDDAVSISQFVNELPDRAGGAHYRLTGWVRTRGLSRGLPFTLKLTYIDDTYGFFSGAETGKATKTPKGNSEWTKLTVNAVSAGTLASATAYATDSRGGFEGTFWIDDVRLSAVE